MHLVRRHLQDYLVVDLEDQLRGRPRGPKSLVDADEGYLENVGRQTLDPGIHGLALPRLADVVVG